MINAVIVEDEYPAIILVRKLVLIYSWINIIGEAENGRKAIDVIETKRPDLVFLDIHLPDMKGFEVLKSISYQPIVIFTTAYDLYAVEAFSTFSIDYLVKPLESDRFDLAMTKLQKMVLSNQKFTYDREGLDKILEKLNNNKTREFITSKVGDKLQLIELKDISHIVADDKYARIHNANGTQHFTEKSLLSLEEKLPNNFIRIHRSTIINKDYISSIRKFIKGRYLVVMGDVSSTILRTSDSYKRIFKDALDL